MITDFLEILAEDLGIELKEETEDQYSLDEIKQEVKERISKLAMLGKDYTVPLEYITEYKIIEDSDAYAFIQPIGEHQYRFGISTRLARKRYSKHLDFLIYHELCHILQIETLVRKNILVYNEDGRLCLHWCRKAAATRLYLKDEGHTSLWYKFVKHVNKSLNVNPPIAAVGTLYEVLDLEEDLEDTFTEKDWIPLESIFHIDRFNFSTASV